MTSRGRTFQQGLLCAVGIAAACAPAVSIAQPEKPGPDLRGLPFTLPYRAHEPAPANYVLETRPLYGLVTAGTILVGFAYVAPLAIAGATGFDDHSGWLAVPVAGPFLWQKRSCRNADARNEDSAGCGVFAPVLALHQLAGFSLLTIGLIARKPHYVRQDLAVSIYPMPNGYRLGVMASF
ncbi:MAG: hypothetical protein AMXMBFR22_33190 [Phycisphaerae bacterium]